VLRRIVAAPTSPVRLAQRAEILLRAFAQEANPALAAAVGLDPTAVGLWRRRWAQAWPKLIRVACTPSPAASRRALADVLADRPRRGNPGKFTPAQVTPLLALACEPPEPSGRPITPWTYKGLADAARKRGRVASISEAQVGRYLREAALPPHESRYWLNARANDPQQFREKVEAVCAWYRAAPRLEQEAQTPTVCTEELTGLQALERVAATVPMRPGPAACREFEYQRHGTTTRIGNAPVVTGQRLAPSLGPTRTEADFVRHVAQAVATDPAAAWGFVVDNRNRHAAEGLVPWVAKACGIEQDLGKKRPPRRAPLASHAAGVPERARPPRPLRVRAEAPVVAEPDGGRLRQDHAEGHPPRQLHLGDRPQGEAGAVQQRRQRGVRQAVSRDVYGAPVANRRPGQTRQASPRHA
jgi:hypothetical protein